MRLLKSIAVAATLIASPAAFAALLPGFTAEKIATTPGFLSSIVFDSSDRLFYSTVDGGIYRVSLEGSAEVARVVTANVGNEGLLGIAFRTDRELITHHVLPDHTAEVIGSVNVETGEVSEIVRIPCDQGRECSSEHHGGNPVLGPDATIYFGVGDFGGGAIAQEPTSPAGKIFRLTSDGTVSMFALGFRNPFDLVFDSLLGKLIVTDNGPIAGDEIHVIGEGDNAGWPLTVGEQPSPPGFVPPVYTFDGTVAPTGISHVKKVGALPFDGLLVGGFVTKALYYFPRSADGTIAPPAAILEGGLGNIIDVAQNGKGEIFFASGSAIYKLGVPLRGDADGNGTVDEGDFAALAREILDGDGTSTLAAQGGSFPGSWGADVNGDGSIDSRDLVALARSRSTRPRPARRR